MFVYDEVVLASNFVNSTIGAYKLNTWVAGQSRKQGFTTAPNRPFTEAFYNEVVNQMREKGFATQTSRPNKRFPSVNLTLVFTKNK